jgi:hypothetical protein
LHPGTMLQHLGFIRSDHRPILLDTDYQADVVCQKMGPRWFEAKWLHEEGFREIVEKAWEDAPGWCAQSARMLACILA